MKTLTYRFQTPQDLLDRLLDEYTDGGMIVATSPFVKEKERVMLDLRVESTLSAYTFQAGVAERQATVAADGRMWKGMKLEFLTVDRVLIEEMMDDLHSGLATFQSRELDRDPLPVDAVVEFDGATTRVPVVDLGPGGAFIADVPGVLVGDAVRVRLVSDTHQLDQAAAAEVAWAGSKGGASGLGLTFVFADRSAEKRWSAAYKRVRKHHRRATARSMRFEFTEKLRDALAS